MFHFFTIPDTSFLTICVSPNLLTSMSESPLNKCFTQVRSWLVHMAIMGYERKHKMKVLSFGMKEIKPKYITLPCSATGTRTTCDKKGRLNIWRFEE